MKANICLACSVLHLGTAGALLSAQCLSHSCLLQDPPEYYDRPGGYLVYSADVPAAMITAAVPATLAAGEKLQLNGTVAHFELVHHQLKQVHTSVLLWTFRACAPSSANQTESCSTLCNTGVSEECFTGTNPGTARSAMLKLFSCCRRNLNPSA